MLLQSSGLTIQPSLRHLNRVWRGLLHTPPPPPPHSAPHPPTVTASVSISSDLQKDFIIKLSAVVTYSRANCAMIFKRGQMSRSLPSSTYFHCNLFQASVVFLFLFWCSSTASRAKSPASPLFFSGWILGFHIWRPCNRYGLSVIGLPCVIHFCNLGDGLM